MDSQMLTTHSGKPNLLKRLNDEILLNLIKERGPISQIELSMISKISPTTVARTCRTLKEEGLIEIRGKNKPNPKGGKHAELWVLNANAGLIVGIAMDVYDTEIVIVDSQNHILWKTVKQTNVEEYKKNLGKKVIEIIYEALEQSDIPLERIIGIGIGITGIVDTQNGIIVTSALSEKKFPLKSIIEQELGLPVIVENDARSMVFCEMKIGAGRGRKNIFGIHLKKSPYLGLGYGIIINGQIYHGASGGAGEADHFDVPSNGLINKLDNKQNLLSNTPVVQYPEIVNKTQKLLKDGMDSIIVERCPINDITEQQVISAAKEGDKLALQVLGDVGTVMGVGMLNVAVLLNPEMIIIDGRLQDAGELLLEPIRKIMRSLSTQLGIGETIMEETKVVFGKVKEHVVSLGATCQMLEKIYRLPHIEFSFLSNAGSKRTGQTRYIVDENEERLYSSQRLQPVR